MNLKLTAFIFIFTTLTFNPTLSKPINAASEPTKRRTTGKLIVRLKKNANARKFDQELKRTMAKDTSAGQGENIITNQYTSLKGYAGVFSEHLKDMLANNPAVDIIEEDLIAHLDELPGYKTQRKPDSWALPRFASRSRNLAVDYIYPEAAGQDITAYIVDSGIDITHPEFEGRAFRAFNAVSEENDQDYITHGTSVASYLGGRTLGTAKKVRIGALKICSENGDCPLSNILAAMDWINKNATPFKTVINLSFSLPPAISLDQAVDEAVAKGFAVIVSAGNEHKDSCFDSPRTSKNVFAVGSTDEEDSISITTNWGPCVKLFAPGMGVLGAIPGGGTRRRSGTSYSAPYVGGLAAIYLSQSPYQTIQQLYDDLVKRATPNAVQSIPEEYYNTTSRLAFLGQQNQLIVGGVIRTDIPVDGGDVPVNPGDDDDTWKNIPWDDEPWPDMSNQTTIIFFPEPPPPQDNGGRVVLTPTPPTPPSGGRVVLKP